MLLVEVRMKTRNSVTSVTNANKEGNSTKSDIMTMLMVYITIMMIEFSS
jgi:hypothetical protein